MQELHEKSWMSGQHVACNAAGGGGGLQKRENVGSPAGNGVGRGQMQFTL